MRMATDREDDLLDIKQAAQFLNVSETSLRRWTNAGRLACLRVGRKRERRFRRADLLGFAEEQPVGAQAVTHLCGLYASDLTRAKLASDFLAASFHPDTVNYLAAAPAARDQIVASLERRRPSIAADIESGRLVGVDYPASGQAQDYVDHWDGIFAAARRAGAHALRVVGDVSGGPALRLERAELVAYEQRYNALAQRLRVPTLSLYDVRHASGLDVLDVLQGHQDFFPHPVDRVVTS
jgi:transcriptional repressor of dcmA and dcmR